MNQKQIHELAIKTAREFLSNEGSAGFSRAVFSIESAIEKSLYPVPELVGSKIVVLYFDTDSEAGDFVNLVKEAKPNMVSRQL